jgi:hypothetical protein
VQLIEHPLDFRSAQHGRNLFSLTGANRFDVPDVKLKNVLEKEQQRMKRVVLSRGCDVPVNGENCLNQICAHLRSRSVRADRSKKAM